MSTRHFTLMLLAGALSLAVLPAAAQAADAPKATAKAAPKGKYVAPKLSWGAPDLNGTWTNASLTTLTRPAQYKSLVMSHEELTKVEGDEAATRVDGNAPTNPNFTVNDLPVNCGRGFSGTNCGYNSGWTDPGETVMRVAGEARTSFLTTPDGKVPPRKAGATPAPSGRGNFKAGMKADDNPETKSLAERCLTSFGASAGPVMLPLLYNNNYQIVQSKDAVVIDIEMVHDARVIHLNQPHRSDGVRQWWGDSIGHYEGNTLVVETTNYDPRNNFQGSSANLKVTEKFTRVAPDRVLYQFTVEDPTQWDKPFGGEYEFGTSKGQLYEYACHEGNYALEGMLAGQREEDRKAEAAKQQPRAEAAPASVTR
jgi:opacity protein-like surface antigen